MAKSKAKTEGPAEHSKGGAISSSRLKGFFKRLDVLTSDEKDIADGIRTVYGEAKAAGFDPKIMRQVYKLRAMEAAERDEDLGLLESYLSAAGLGPLFDRPPREHDAAADDDVADDDGADGADDDAGAEDRAGAPH